MALGAMAGLCGVTVGDPDLGDGAAQEIADHRRAAVRGDHVVDRGGRQQHPLPPGFPADPGRGLVRGDHLGIAHLLSDRRGGNRERGFGAGQQVGDGALADGDTKHLVEQLGQPLKANRLADMQVQDQCHQAGTKGRAWGKTVGGRRAKAAAAARADAAVAVNPRDHRPHRRQIEMIVSVHLRLVCRGQAVRAVGTAIGKRLDNPVRVVSEPAKPPRMPLAPRLPTTLGLVRLGAARRRQRRVIRGLRRLAELCLQFGNPPGQFLDLRRQRLDLRRLRQHQRDQLFRGEVGERFSIHLQVESRDFSPVNQNLCINPPATTKCAYLVRGPHGRR